MQRICITMLMLGVVFALSSTVQAQQSEWIPPLPMPMESLFAPYQGYQPSGSYAPAQRQPLAGRFTGNLGRRVTGWKNVRTPIPMDSNYGYGNWRYNGGTSAQIRPFATESVIQESHVTPQVAPVPPREEIPPAPPQMTERSTMVDLPIVVPPKSTSSPEIIVPPVKPKKMESEPEIIIRPRKVSEIPPPAVRVPSQKLTEVIDVEPASEENDSFIEIEEEISEEAPLVILEETETPEASVFDTDETFDTDEANQTIEEEDPFSF